MMKNKIVEHAFHMPITAQERATYRRIAELVRKDEYLPLGYRKPKQPAPIINNKNHYSN